MAVGQSRWVRRAVSPLELFFDLVFVLAIGQLTHHLVTHLNWRGAAETLVMTVAVCGVWAFTTFEVTLLDIERPATRAVAVVAMGLGLLMNAGVSHAFEDGQWLFVVPLLLALVAPALYARAAAPSPQLRSHFGRVLIWVGASAPLWIAGALVDNDVRLWPWTVAALIDLVGSFTAHPLPGRSAHTQRLPFDTDHMLERMRLFVIILLGETVLTLGRVLAEHHSDQRTLLATMGGFVALVCLWAVYFGGSEQIVVSHATNVQDPIRVVHLAINAVYGVIISLVVLAAGTELLLAHAEQRRAGIGGVLIGGGPALYLMVHAFYFRTAIRSGSRPRAIGTVVLAGVAVVAYWLPPLVVIGVLDLTLLALVVSLSRGDQSDPSRTRMAEA